MRVIVVGGGVIGLLTALECALRGATVTVIDQAAMPNPCGTSYDRHRIVRALHPRDAVATRAAVAARHAWAAIERLLDRRLLVPTGALSVLPHADADGAASLLADAGAEATVIGDRELAARYAHLRFEDGRGGVLEPQAGVILADRALGALVAFLAARADVRLRPFTMVAAIDPDGAGVRCADGRILRADRLVVAAGPWSQRLLAPAASERLQLVRQSVLYCRVPATLLPAWEATPAVPVTGDADRSWLMPPVACTPLKLSAPSAARVVDEVGAGDTPAASRDDLVRVLRRLVPGADASWVSGARDFHYLSDPAVPGPVLRPHGGGGSWALAACGGTAFKLAPLVSRTLAGCVLDQPHHVHASLAGAAQ